MANSGGPLDIKLGGQNGRLLHWPKCCCVSTKTKLWKSLLRPDIYFPSLVCPLAHHNFPFLATAHDCKITGLSVADHVDSWWRMQSSKTAHLCSQSVLECVILQPSDEETSKTSPGSKTVSTDNKNSSESRHPSKKVCFAAAVLWLLH